MRNVVKVGIFASICLVVLALLIWNIEGLNPFAPEGRRIDAIFDSVAGLDDKASVRVAGVRIGQVDGVGLEGQRARISILPRASRCRSPQGRYARIANLGLLGEKYVELVPGPPDAPPLPPDAVLRGVTPPTIDDAIAQLSEIGESIQRVTGSLAEGDLGGNMNRLVAEIEATSREIRSLVAENRANVGSAVAQLRPRRRHPRRASCRASSAQMSRALDQIATLVEENRGQLGESIGNVRELTEQPPDLGRQPEPDHRQDRQRRGDARQAGQQRGGLRRGGLDARQHPGRRRDPLRHHRCRQPLQDRPRPERLLPRTGRGRRRRRQ